MKKILTVFIFMLFLQPVFASQTKDLPYKNLKEGGKICLTESNLWQNTAKKNSPNTYIKQGTEFLSQSDLSSFETACNYLYINNGHLYGYSPSDLKFYEFVVNEDKTVAKRELTFDETASQFKDFRLILLSEFSDSTNVYKIKKKRHEEKILLINDTDGTFDDYKFTTNNSIIKTYPINNAIEVTKDGLIQFSFSGENAKNYPWFIILVR